MECMARSNPLECDKCGTQEFSVVGKAFDMGFICESCNAVMCFHCAGRYSIDGPINGFTCFRCGAKDPKDAFFDWSKGTYSGNT